LDSLSLDGFLTILLKIAFDFDQINASSASSLSTKVQTPFASISRGSVAGLHTKTTETVEFDNGCSNNLPCYPPDSH